MANANMPRKLLDHGLAVLLVEMDEDLGVAARLQHVAGGAQLALEVEVVVDLAIEDDADRAVLVPDRLRAALEIDDAEPPHAEREPVRRREVRARAVRPAVDDPAEHLAEQALRFRLGKRTIDESCDAAHGSGR